MMMKQRTKPVPIQGAAAAATSMSPNNSSTRLSQRDALLSQSLGSTYSRPVLQRRASDNLSKISHAGYLLKRSNTNTNSNSVNSPSKTGTEEISDYYYDDSSCPNSPTRNHSYSKKRNINNLHHQQQQALMDATASTLASTESTSSCLAEQPSSPHTPQHWFAQETNKEDESRRQQQQEQQQQFSPTAFTTESTPNEGTSTSAIESPHKDRYLVSSSPTPLQTSQSEGQPLNNRGQETSHDLKDGGKALPCLEQAVQCAGWFLSLALPRAVTPAFAQVDHDVDDLKQGASCNINSADPQTPPRPKSSSQPQRTPPIKMQRSLSSSFRGAQDYSENENDEEEDDDDDDDDDELAALNSNGSHGGNIGMDDSGTSYHRSQSDRMHHAASNNKSDITSRPRVDVRDEETGRTLWKSKYCVLEDGILYFYRHQSDAEAPQAMAERLADLEGGGYGGTATTATNHALSHSPLPATFYQDGTVTTTTTAASALSNINNSGNGSAATPLWEKRVAVDCVAAVRSAEVEYGRHSFELLPVGRKEDKLVLQARNADEMSEWLFQFHRSIAMYVQNMVSMLDQQRLSGVSTPGPSTCSSSGAATTMSAETGTSSYFHPGDIHHPAFAPNSASHVPRVPPSTTSSSYVDYSPMRARAIRSNNDANAAAAAAAAAASISMAYSPRYQQRPISSAVTPSLSHGHGRNSKHRRRLDGKGHESSDDDDAIGDEELMHDYLEPSGAPLMPSTNASTSPESPTLPFPMALQQQGQDIQQQQPQGFVLHPSPSRPIVPLMSSSARAHPPSQSFGMEDGVTSPELSAPPSADPETERPLPVKKGKYVPPHLRKKQAAAAAAAAPAPTRYVPPHLRGRAQQQATGNSQPQLQQQPSLSLTERAAMEPTRVDTPTETIGSAFTFEQESPLPSTPKEPPVDPSAVKLGGCADPTVVKGSIKDSQFIPRKASKLGKVHTDPYGCNNESIHSGHSQIRWEIGAVSECGVRNSNEDAYLIANDLLEAFHTNDETARTHFHRSEDAHVPGLFCVFDGHCGDHAARFAAEHLTSFIHKESVLGGEDHDRNTSGTRAEQVESILRRALMKLDQEFCEFSGKEGREWESGATALVVLFVNGNLVIANLGDARGVVCRSVDEDRHASKLEQERWTELPFDDYNGDRRCLWKEVTDAHSPARDDERIRIEAAGGWITTEKEIPIGQVHRMVLEDQDVLNILHRCFADRYQPSSKAAAPQRILHISRVCGELAVSRALGDKDFKAAFNPESKGTTKAEWDCPLFLPYPNDHNQRFLGDLVSNQPDFQALRVGESGAFDEFLVLACDGLWDVMDADDAVRVTRDLLFEKNWPAKKVAARLAELAMHLGSSDNITVIVLRFYKHQIER